MSRTRAPRLRIERLESRVVPALMPAGTEFRVNTYVVNQQRNQSVDMDSDGDFVVVWESTGQDGSIDGIYAQRYNALGAAQGAEFRVNTYITNNQSNASVALDSDGDFVVAWSSYGQDGQYDGVYARRFNAAGTALGGEFRVSVTTLGSQTFPSVAIDDDGDFVVAWVSPDGGGTSGIFARRYDPAGTALTSEFRVNTTTAGFQYTPSVSMDAVGNFVVVWESPQDGNLRGVYGRRYNAAGTALAGEFRVNTYTTGEQYLATVGVDTDGDFVVVWQSTGQDGNAEGVYAQRYNSAGAAQGSEFRVNVVTIGPQAIPTVAVDAAGNFIVGWGGSDDGNVWGAYVRHFDAVGTPLSGEIRANTYTTNYQSDTVVAADSSGDFVATWISIGQDGDSRGLYGQRFQNVLPPRVQSVQVNDASAQRSRVTGITVTFDSPVSLPGSPATAFQLQRQSDSALVSLSAVPSGNSVTLSFTAGPLDSGSLADGRYTLTVLASQIPNLDGNGDGTAGDNYVLTGDTTNKLFRLYGDADGTGMVDAADFLAFRLAYLSASSMFDSDNSGQVDAADLLRFRLSFLGTV